MRCPYCNYHDTQVKDSRPSDEGATIRRRRQCPNCGSRFTTFERVQLKELTVVKRSGLKRIFDRDKLSHSIRVAARKRPVTEEQIEATVSSIVQQLENRGEAEISVVHIGEAVMEALPKLDKVAYIRFASVYKDFNDPGDFEEFLSKLEEA